MGFGPPHQRTKGPSGPFVVNGRRRAQVAALVDATPRKVDRLVYQLYNLTDAEITLVDALGRPAYARRPARWRGVVSGFFEGCNRPSQRRLLK